MATCLTTTASSTAFVRKGTGRQSRKLTPRAAVSGGAPPTTRDTVKLGKSNVEVSAVGAGAWSWGDRSGYWGYQKSYEKGDNLAAFRSLIGGGVTFIDTAEVYGFGLSETFLGEFMGQVVNGNDAQIATKFGPLPWRVTRGAVPKALRASLGRLQKDKIDLYLQHWPGFALNGFSNDAFADGLADCLDQGLCKAAGVSNFSAERITRVSSILRRREHVLSSNQVQYSLIYREPENNGVLEACRDNGVTLISYSPLAQGLLTNKYVAGGDKPSGPRGASFTDEKMNQMRPLLEAMGEIGKGRGKTCAQIAINWVVCKGGLPIPGVKDQKQAEEAAGALGWRLDEGEVAELDRLSKSAPKSNGAPFEKW